MSGAAPVLRVGCAVWADRQWIGRYFPNDTPPGHELRAYATWCNAVEGNTTFYGLPSEATVARWAADAPDDLRLMFKLPRTITHDRRLRHCEVELAEALTRLAPLEERAAPVSIQLPASFTPGDLGVLDRFLSRLPTEWLFGVEVRHERFCDAGRAERALNDLLFDHGVERILLDTRAVFAGPVITPYEVEAVQRKPRLPVRPVAIGVNPVVRFIGQTEPEANPQWWSKWVPKIAQWLDQGRSPTFFVHTPDNAVAPELARRFHGEVRALRPQLAPLPDPETAVAQLRLLGS